MARPLIALDLDEVLAQHNAGLAAWHNTNFGTTHTAADYFTDHWKEVWHLSDIETKARAKGFFTPKTFASFQPVPHAFEGLASLRQAGCKLVVITVRRSQLALATKQWIATHFPNMFSDVHFAFNRWEQARGGFSKGRLCQQLGATLLIDDNVKHCQDAVLHGIPAVLFGNYTWNKISVLPNGITQVYDWPALVRYIQDQKEPQ